MNPTAQRFHDRAQRFGEIIDAADGQWDAPTPCDDWSVRDVIDHAVETERDFFDKRGLDLAPAPDTTDLAQAWRAHTAAMVDVLGRDGVAETAYDGYFGPTTVADTMADFYGWDLMIHSWDIARATGQEWSIADEEVERLNRTADGWGDALHSEGVCAPEVALPDDASAQDRLLARLGRDPQWRAAQPTR
ncbi:TIGR03086 family metal-binding protein [Nocardioides sp. InS609-2]|uniref:TIGR03086 family metal-binding protein n=1 Tax=Nocardioides sp. InS609-2 TaxID=2760705 RepID=UPI0020BDF412|nr:TIGR03086 family metal-binding protein [Nocardioides sp. InS609-2]